METKKYKLLIKNAAQVVCVRTDDSEIACGPEEQGRVDVVAGPASVAVGVDGRIAAVGPDASVLATLGVDESAFAAVVDAAGGCVLPGLVDAHTHPVWAGDRVGEFALKLAGASYMEVHRQGGGIGSTVRATRAASEEALGALLRARADRMLAAGTTLAEAKSGYGLDTASELKLLRVLHRHNTASGHPLELVATLLGAHSVPEGTDAETQTRLIIDEMIPAVAAARARGEVGPEFCDVFHETGIFDQDQTRRILLAGRAHGLAPNFHGDELSHAGSAELAAEPGLAPRAISHLERVSDAGIAAMAAQRTVAVVLPTTAYLMRLDPPPVRRMIAAGVPVALGSDYNPNAHCLSMPATMNVACVLCHMTMPEALVAATLNAAASIGRARDYGSLQVGRYADCLILAAPRWEHIIYQIADPPITHVFKKGSLVFKAVEHPIIM